MQATNSSALTALAALVALASPAAASPIGGDVELDPTAYALAGNSLHVGIGHDHLRLDLGNYALDLPRFVHGDDDFDVSFTGYGAKLQWFRRADRTGAFVGVDAGVVRVHAHLRGTELGDDDLQLGTGVHGGYRWSLPAGFYATGWLGVGYVWSADDIVVDGNTFAASPLTIFPAVHLGYRFR